MLAEPIEITLLLVDVLERLGVRYLVGGSLASSLHGIPRATHDVDLVAELRDAQVQAFVEALEAAFFVDADAVREAIRLRAHFNVIHLATMFKVDVFIPPDEAGAQEEMARSQRVVLEEESGRALVLASPEDIVAQKLHWFKLGGGVSDRQWQDVLGVLQVQGANLDRTYLSRASAALGVASLLAKALAEAGLDV